MVLQVTTTPEADGSAANVCLLEQCLHCCEEAKGKQNKLKQFFQKIISLITQLDQKGKDSTCFIPNGPEVRVDRTALCNTELCRETESLIFIQQQRLGSFANVVILFPSYMQHFPVTTQSHDQTLTQSDSAHSHHSAGL